MIEVADRGGRARAGHAGLHNVGVKDAVPVRDAAGEEELTRAVAAARDGDEAAFRLLYRDTQPRLLRYVRALVGEDAEDVTSEAWLQISRDLPRFRGDLDKFRGWAATVARNRALDLLRRQARRPVADLPAEALAALAADGDTASLALDGMATEAALTLIAELPRDQAEAVLLRVVVGLDAKTAGKVLGKRPGAVRTSAYRGLRRLASRLSGDESAVSGAEGTR
ncbi:RNA polymerase sigma factor [Actinomadura kijaniata]